MGGGPSERRGGTGSGGGVGGLGAGLADGPVEAESRRGRRRAVEAEEQVDDEEIVGESHLQPLVVGHGSGEGEREK